MKMRVIQVRGNWKDYVDIHTLVSHGIDVATGLAAAIDRNLDPSISIQALRFYSDGTLDRVPAGMQRDLTRWAQAVDLGKVPVLHLKRGMSPGARAVTLTTPYPEELLRVARKVVWYERPEQTLVDLKSFLTHLMVYGSPADLAVVERYVPEDEFRRVLEDAPAGVFTQEAWKRWHERFGMSLPALPRRRFPDGSVGPEAGGFFGR
jgi:hypothetical protein